MTTVLIVIHLMVVLAMIGLVLLQRSEGGALGIGGGAGGFMTGRGAGNVLTHATGVLAIVFFVTSIGLAFLARMESRPSDIFDTLPGQSQPAAPAPPVPAPAAGAPTSAEDVLRGLGGASGTTPGPQAPPAGEGAGGSEAPAAEGAAPAADSTAAPAPATTEPPAAAAAPGPQAPAPQ
jgi:preprotein translocase subunit SecG